jgi:ATP-dependent RNA helicase RhlE
MNFPHFIHGCDTILNVLESHLVLLSSFSIDLKDLEKEQAHMKTFRDLGLDERLLKAVEKEGYTTPTEIQAQAIPILLEGHDLLGTAQTGTGKTAAFAFPMIQAILKAKGTDQNARRFVRGLVLAPTRELAQQIMEAFLGYARFANLRITAIYGGVGKGPQINQLKGGTDIVVGTPGRILDLINMGFLKLNDVKMLVLDEADQMFDMGFLPDVKKIIGLTAPQRVSAMFSATMPSAIEALSHVALKSPRRISVTPVEKPIDAIKQQAYAVEKNTKISFLIHLLKNPEIKSALIFTRTKRGAKKVAQQLIAQGIRTEELHGNKSQAARQQALNKFKELTSRVLVATDIASRGIDIHQLSHVINYELPETAEVYLHRMGRTGRAGFSGVVISIVGGDETFKLRMINRHLGTSLVAVKDTTFLPSSIVLNATAFEPPMQNRSHFQHRRFNQGQKPSRGEGSGQQGGYPRGGSSSYQGNKPSRSEGSGQQGGYPRGGSSSYQGNKPSQSGGGGGGRPQYGSSRPSQSNSNRPRRPYNDSKKENK